MTSNNLEQKIKELRETVATSCRIIHKMGLAHFLEHVAARVPGEDMLITNPIGSLKNTQPEELLVVDFNFNVVEGPKKPRGWALIFIEAFKAREDVNGIVHTHQPMGLIFGMTGRKVASLLHSACPNSSKETSCYDNPSVLLPDDWQRAKEIVEAIGDNDICFIQNHGIEFLGKSVEDATVAAIHLEQQCYMNYYATAVGFPKPVSEENVEVMKKFHQNDLQPRTWKYYSDLIKEEDEKEAREKEMLSLLKSINEKL